MKTGQWITFALLLLLVFAAGIGLVLTRGGAHPEVSESASSSQSIVDQTPLLTARKMAALASTPDQQHLANEALRLADHEVDLAFADTLRSATQHPAPVSPEIKQLSARLEDSQARLKADQTRNEQLKRKIPAASDRDALQQQLDLLQAQLELDQDEVEDAQEDLSRAGGDPKSRIQHLLDEHEASSHQSSNASNIAATEPNPSADNLLTQFTAWRTFSRKQELLENAGKEAASNAASLQKAHDQLESEVQKEKTSHPQFPDQPANKSGAVQPASSADQGAATTLSSLRRLSENQKNLSDLDKRAQDHQDLEQVYRNWASLVSISSRTTIHGMIQSLLWILLIILVTYLIQRLLEKLLVDATPEKRRLRTIRTVSRFALQAVALLLILIVVFGTPNQTPTILGLAGAGLTVALKDFIVAFFGWFVLMGRNGLRVGDWVEINGVVGEVVEVGILRTVLLETGNWNDAGHPTGRKVAFVNSFAIEGHFFNFSTTGQWLWDEIQVLVPASENPYPLIDAIQQLVTHETATGAQAAEEEWRRATHRPALASVSAAPAINVRPTSSGVQVLVRYITRAHERFEMRSRLYQAIVDLLHRRKATQVTVGSSSGSRTSD